jgi:hypothetical protein
MRADLQTSSGLAIGEPTPVANFRIAGNPGQSPNYDFDATGQRFLVRNSPALTSVSAQTGGQIVIVQNWFEELERRVPME